MADERVTITLDVDTRGEGKIAGLVASMRAAGVALEQMGGRWRRFMNVTSDNDKFMRSQEKAFNALTGAAKGAMNLFGKFTSLLSKGFLISLGATSAALLAVKVALVAGRVAAKAYQATMMGLAAGTATVAAGLYTLAAAQREYQAAIAQVRYQPNQIGGRRGAADQALRSLTGNTRLAIAGNENLVSTFQAVSRQTQVTPEIVKALEGMGDFVAATGDFKNLAAGGEFVAGLVKAKGLTEEVVGNAGKLGPEFTDAMKKLQSEGKTSVGEVLNALSSGAAATSVGLQGALTAVNQTLFGSFKSNFQQLRDLAADIGLDFLKPATNSVNTIGQTFRSAMIRSSYAVNAFINERTFNSLNNAVQKLTTWGVRMMEDYLPKTEGFFTKIRQIMRTIADWFRSVGDYLRPLENAADILINVLAMPIKAIFGGFADGVTKFAELVEDNKKQLNDFGEGIAGFIAATGKLFGSLKQAFMDALPVINTIVDALTGIVQAMNAVVKILRAGLGKEIGGAVALVGMFAGASLLKKGTGSAFFRGGRGLAGRSGMGGAGGAYGGGMSSTGVMNVTAGTVNITQGPLPGGGGTRGTGGMGGAGGAAAQQGRFRAAFGRFANRNPLLFRGAYSSGGINQYGGIGGPYYGPPTPVSQMSRGQLVGSAVTRGVGRAGFGTSLGVTLGGQLAGSAIGGEAGRQVSNVTGVVGTVGMLAPLAGLSAGPAMLAAGIPMVGLAAGKLSGGDRTMGTFGGAAGGAALGAALGSVVPGLGTAAGAIAGGIIGGGIAFLKSSSEAKRLAEEWAKNFMVRYDDALKAVAEDPLGEKSITEFADIYKKTTKKGYDLIAKGEYDRGTALLAEAREFQRGGKQYKAYIQNIRNVEMLSKSTGRSTQEVIRLANALGIDLTKKIKDVGKVIESILGIRIITGTASLEGARRDLFQQALDETFNRTIEVAEGRRAIQESNYTLQGKLRSGMATGEDIAMNAQATAAYEYAVSGGNMMQAAKNIAAKMLTDRGGGRGTGLMFREGSVFADLQDQYIAAGGDTQTKAFLDKLLAGGITQAAASIKTKMPGMKIGEEQLQAAYMPIIQQRIQEGGYESGIQELQTFQNKIAEGGGALKAYLEGLGVELDTLKTSYDLTEEAMRQVAQATYDASMALGAFVNGIQTIRLPGAIPAAANTGIPFQSSWSQSGKPIYLVNDKWFYTSNNNPVPDDELPKGWKDTATPRGQRVGDSRTSRFRRTLGRHFAIAGMLGGKQRVTSGIRFNNLGSPSSDHTTGAAIDITGDNLGAYANMVRNSGGFAEFHGAAGSRHLHAVPGTGAMGDMANPVGPMSGSGESIANHTYYLTVNPSANASAEEIAEAVMTKIERVQRSNRERI